MKFKHIYSALVYSLMSSAAFSTSVPLADEPNEQTRPMGPTLYAATLMEIMNRDYLTMDQERYNELCRLGRDARKTDKDRAIFYFSQAAQYGQLGAFKELGLCYSGKGDMVLAYKWWAWAVQEAYMTRVSAQNSDYKMCIQFLNHEGNKQKLRQVFQDDEKLGSFFDAWDYDFSKIDWIKNHRRVKQYEPYLSPEELESKKNLFFYRHLVSCTNNLDAYYHQLKIDDKKVFFKEIMRMNNQVVQEFVSQIRYQDLVLEEAQLYLKKTFDILERKLDFSKISEDDITYEIYKNFWVKIIFFNYFRVNYQGEPFYNDIKIFQTTRKLYENNFINPDIINQLARMYFKGCGCEKNIKQAIVLARQENILRESSATHYNIAYFSMRENNNPHIDYNDIRFHFLKAAELGDGDALVELGYMSCYGLGCEKSLDDAVAFYKEAQDKGNIGGNAGLWNIALSYPQYDHELSSSIDFKDQATRDYLKKKHPALLAQILETIDNNIEEAVCFYKEGLSFNDKPLISNIYIIYRLINIYKNYYGRPSDSPEIVELMKEFYEDIGSECISTRLYCLSYRCYLFGNYTSALDYLNGALLAGHKDIYGFFEKIQKKLDSIKEKEEEKQREEDRARRKQQKLERQEALEQAQEDRERRKQEKLEKRQARYKEKVQARLSDFQLLDNGNQVQEPQPLTIHFINQDVENDFKEAALTNDKIRELLTDIAHNPLKGTGKPERLKYGENCCSRRINHKDRLVYRIDGPGVITIIACKGHYDKI